MPKITVDGREMEVEPGTTVLQAAEMAGQEIPHYCYHPGLSVAGNCRICLVEVEGMPTVQISCNLAARDGMVIHTQSEKAKDARSDVMELLLINHPLDCPICDQAGECKLQEYSFELGSGSSRFDVPKRHKRKNIRFSDKVVFDAERCIVCTRCVRFTEEITETHELTVVDRGDRSEIDVAPGAELESPYQMNVIDICPVGALTSADFRFQSRVWFMEQKRTVCNSCSRGCNVMAGTRWNRVLRLVPAENANVNQWWMCDHGRLNIKDVAAENRLIGASVDGKPSTTDAALDRIAAALKDGDGKGVVGLVSARLTNEECWLGRRLLGDSAGSPNLDLVPREHEGDNFLLTTDRNPNTTGARAAGVSPANSGYGLDGLKASVEAGEVKALILIGDDLDERPDDLALLEKIPFVAVIGSHDNETTKRAHAVLPGATWAEKGGTVTNLNGRVQRLQSLVRLPGQAKPDSHWLLHLLQRTGAEGAPDLKASPPALFRAMTKDVDAFADLTWKDLGEHGSLMKGATEPADAQGGVPGTIELLASTDPTQWVQYKPEFLDFLPDLVFQAIGIFAVLQMPPALVVFLVWGERRISAWMQDRLGPNRVGPYGLLQSVADLVKFVFKEDVMPGQTTKILFQMAPAMALIPAMLTFSMLPFSQHFMVSDLNVGLLMLFALSSLGVYGIQIGGWASNSKYSLIGGVRASAQIISYELTMGLAAAVVVLFTGSLNLKEIVMWQGDHLWVAFMGPAGFIAFLIFVTSAFAETNRLPFDMPEAESELAAGYHTEYSSMKFALFFLAEYTAMIVMSGLMTTLFLGGWTLFGLENMFAGPDGEPTLMQTLLQVGIWWGKTICWLLIFIWVRWTLPRFRYDQLMRLGWKIFLPASLVNLLLAAATRVFLDSTWYEV